MMAPRKPTKGSDSAPTTAPVMNIIRPDFNAKRTAPVPVARPPKKSANGEIIPHAVAVNTIAAPVQKSKVVTMEASSDDDIEEDEDMEDMDMEDMDMEDMEEMMEEDEDDDVDDENIDVEEVLDLDSNAKMNKLKREADGTYKDLSASVDNDSEESDVDTVDVSLEFFDLNPERDYHAVRSFLSHYTDDADLNINEFSDLISAQVEVGTVVKADDAGAEPLGFITALDLNLHKEKECMKQVKEFILENMGNQKNRSVIEDLLNNAAKSPVGLLIQDRVKNLPMEVVPVLYNELRKDIEWAGKDFNFENFILLSKCCEVSGNMVSSITSKKKKNKEEANGEVWYLQFEDEFFREQATFVRKFPGKNLITWPGVGRVPSSYVVMVIPKKGLAEVVDRLNGMLTVNGQSLC